MSNVTVHITADFDASDTRAEVDALTSITCTSDVGAENTALIAYGAMESALEAMRTEFPGIEEKVVQ